MHSTSVRESLIESPVILSSSKPQNIVSTSANSFEYPAILSLPKHCFVCFWWRRRLRTLQFYSLPNRVDAVSFFAKDLRTLQFYSPPSHKASAATQSACLRILQSPFQAGNSSAHQKNLVWVPCSFFFSKTSGSVAARVWVPCNFIFFQTIKMLRAWHQPLFIVSTSLFSFATKRSWFEFPIWTLWVPFLRALQFFSLIWMACNFTFFQPKVAT